MSFFPIWGGIAFLISLLGLLIAQFEEYLSVSKALYFAWVTGTTVGYGELVPTLGIMRVLAILVATMGITLTGIIVAMAIEAAIIVAENNTSIKNFRQSVKESAERRVARDRKRRLRQLEEDG